MTVKPNQHLFLHDSQGQDIGEIVVSDVKDDLVSGRFEPGSGFPGVRHVFAEYVEAANDQLFSIVGELDATITAMGLHLRSPEMPLLPAIYDVLIGDAVVTFRLRTTPAPKPERSAASPLPSSGVHPESRPV